MADEASFTVRLVDKVTGSSRAIRKALGSVTSSLTSLGSKAKVGDRAVGRVSDAAGRLRQAGDRASKASGGMLGDIVKGNLISSAISKVLDLGVSVAVAGAEFVTFGQNARMAFDQLAKHGATPEKLFEHSRALATRFGLDVQDTTKQYQKFLALQFDPKQADKMIRMGADLQALGNSAEDVKGVFLALGQIKGKGRFQGEEMLQLAERGISTVLVQEEIGKALGGKSTVEVQKLQQAGKITADVALGAIESAIKRKLQISELGEAGAKFADKTLSGMWGRFKATGQDKAIQLVDKITDPVTKLAGGAMSRITGFLDSPQGAATIDAIATGLGKAAEFAGSLADSFGGGFSTTLGAIWESVKPLVESFAGGDGSTLKAVLGAVATHLGQAAAIALAGAGAFMAVAAGIGMLGHIAIDVGFGLVEGLTKPLFAMIGDAVLWWDNLKAIWDSNGLSLGEKALAIGKALVTGFANGIWSLVKLPVDAVAGMASEAIAKLKGVLGVHSPSTAAYDVGAEVPPGMANAITAGESTVRSASAGLADAAMQGLSTSSDMAGPMVTSGEAGNGFGTSQSFGRGGNVFHLTQTFEIHGSADAEETAQLAARASRREMEAFFRELDME